LKERDRIERDRGRERFEKKFRNFLVTPVAMCCHETTKPGLIQC